MEKFFRVTLSQPDEYKPAKGDAMATRSDSHETVEMHNQKASFKSCKRIGGSSTLNVITNYILPYDDQAASYKYIENVESGYYYVHLRRRTIFRCTKQYLKKKYSTNGVFMKTLRHKDNLIVIDKTDWYKPQAFPHIERLLGLLYDKTKDVGSKIAQLFTSLKYYSSNLSSSFSLLSRIDWGKLGDLIISIFFSAATALCGIYGVIQFLYNLFKFTTFISSLLSTNGSANYEMTNEEYEPQNMSLEALMAGFALMGLPSSLLEKIKNFALLTGVKVHASHSFSTLFAKIKNILIAVVDYVFSFPGLLSLRSLSNPIVDIVNYLFSPFGFYDDILLVSEQYTQFIKDNSILHNPVFRNEVMELYNRLIIDNSFLDYIRNNDNKHFSVTWNAYKQNLVKFINTYSVSSRDEPICIVFDGPPGCGKSVLMNRFVELLKTHNKSVYTHTVPPSETSKDFYDDYMNQNVFVMDDVGQQGKSQWRTIINFVSPVKYPLDCAQADKKNTKFFQSELILCTTNNFKHLGGFTSKDGISCPDALFRRVHLISVGKNRGQGTFSQRLSYSKYDEQSGSWRPKFLGPNNTTTDFCPRLDRFPYEVVTPDEGGTEAALTWLFLLYNHLVESNKRDREMTVGYLDHSTTIDKVLTDPLTCIDELTRYKPQLFETIYEEMNESWNSVLNGVAVFKEYVNYLTVHTERLFKKLFNALFTRIMMPLWDIIISGIDNSAIEFKMLMNHSFTFFRHLIQGDFVEERRVNTNDCCFICLENYSDMAGSDDDEARATHIPVTLLSCGHTICPTCTVLRQQFIEGGNAEAQRTCGLCRAEIRDERPVHYIGDNQVSYEVVRNYVKDSIGSVTRATYDVIDKLVDVFATVFHATDFHSLVNIYLLIVTQTILFYGVSRLLASNRKPQSASMGVFDWIFGRKTGCDVTYAQFEESSSRAQSLMNGLKFNTTSANAFKKNHCRIMVDTRTQVHTCIIVSGKRFLTNSHVNPDDIVVDIYQSYDHMREGHKEMESVRVKVVKNYLASDVCLCEFVDVIPFYKIFNRFGGVDSNKFNLSSFVSPYGVIPLVPGINLGKNHQKVTYRYKIRGETRIVDHHEGAGVVYGVQGAGLCGSVVYSEDRVVGIHVTGNGKEGFAQVFPEWLCQELNEGMFSHPTSGNFEVRDDIIPNFSGVRLTYNQDPKWVNHGATCVKTSFLPSELHISMNENTRKMYHTIKELQDNGEIAPTELEVKVPPVFGNNKKEVKENMVRLSRKSFKHQGSVTDNELEYIRKCIRAILPDSITDLSDEETSFGGENVKGFKSDTSNGFACAKDKTAYLDFENRLITEEGRAVLNRFKLNAANETYCEDDFVCRETLKDELRTEAKKNDPRLFRVMPFPHIWWTKKILGRLIPWFKDHLHEFGICVGFNPYKDFDRMVRNLKTKAVHGDEDYSKWDGSLLALIVLLIRDEFIRIYKGDNADVLNYVMITLSRPWTLISDELYATTHSLPSGTWVTLLVNCLVNKALVALTLFRNKNDVTVDDFLSLVSYVCGDDKIFGSDIDSNYNLLTVKDTAESLGMTVTNGDKTAITSPSRNLMDLNFLKRNIIFHPVLKRYVGALSISTMFNTLQWYNIDKVGESLTYDDLMRDKCNAVLIEAFLHGRNCFLNFRDYMSKCGITELFTEEKVIKILQDDDGYEVVLNLLKKNYLN